MKPNWDEHSIHYVRVCVCVVYYYDNQCFNDLFVKSEKPSLCSDSFQNPSLSLCLQTEHYNLQYDLKRSKRVNSTSKRTFTAHFSPSTAAAV